MYDNQDDTDIFHYHNKFPLLHDDVCILQKQQCNFLKLMKSVYFVTN